MTQFVKIAFESVDDRRFKDLGRSENLGGGGRVIMGWAESTPLVEIRVTDLQKSGGEWGLLPMVPASLKICYVCKYLLISSTRSP